MSPLSKKLPTRPAGALPALDLMRGGAWCAAGFLMIAAVAAPALAQTGADAVFAVTYLDVGVGTVPEGVELIQKYRDQSRREGANLEFTILQEVRRPNRFVIMEGWRDQAAFNAHDKSAA